jgi:hypothetical protein
MFMLRKYIILLSILTLSLVGLLSCTATQAEVLPTAVPLAIIDESPRGGSALPTAVVTVEEPVVTSVPTAVSPNTTAPTTYQVAFVESNDVLNVRSGPGVDYGIVGELAPDADNVALTGLRQFVDGSTWVSIQAGSVAGWVNSRFLAERAAGFCDDAAVVALLGELETAVSNHDSNHFSRLVHPERGLQIHHDWWNPKIRIEGDHLNQIFTNDVSYEWGIADGSGDAIVGSFVDIILPPLEDDFLGATQTACNDILHGGTAGYVRLPDGYEQVNYYAYYRPAGDIEFDWGTWVVGVEQWQGQWYVSYLVHFDWEI